MTAQTIEELIEDFALFEDWEDKYRYLIDLGQRLAPMDEALKTEETRVKGCTSAVWMVANCMQDGCYKFTASSDALIVSGLIYILLSAYQGKDSASISHINIDDAFNQLGLKEHLSPSRRNGFYAMVERIKSLAA
jgi:cysteine desulfuration protein SufE